MILALAVLWVSVFGDGKLVHSLFRGLRNNVIGTDFLSHFSEGGELIKSSLSDGDDSLNDVPHDAFGARSGGKRALVCESPVVVDELHKLGQVEWTLLIILLLWCVVLLFHLHLLMLLFIYQLHQKLIVIQNLRILFFPLFKILIRHHLEQKSQHSSHKLRSFWVIWPHLRRMPLLLYLMDNMHLKVHQFSIN